MLSSFLLALLVSPTVAPEPERYWIDLTTSPGQQGFGRIVNGYAVDITARRSKPGGAVQAGPPLGSQVPSDAALFLAALNVWRAQHGRGPLQWDAGLAAFASRNYTTRQYGPHHPASTGGAMQCWAGTGSLTAALGMWQVSGPHASILLNASSVIGAARCPTGSTCNAR